MFDLLRFRKDHNLSQGEIGQIIDQSQAYVSQIEKGTRPFLEEYYDKLKRIYVDIDSYMTESVVNEEIAKYQRIVKNKDDIIREKDTQIEVLEKTIEVMRKLISYYDTDKPADQVGQKRKAGS